MQLVLDTHGLTVKVRNRSFYIIGKEDKRLIGPERLTSIAVTADCLFSTAALRLAAQRQIPVYLVGDTGDVEGRLWSPHFVGLASLRRAQAIWLEDGPAAIWLLRLAMLKTKRQSLLIQGQTSPDAETATLLQSALADLENQSKSNALSLDAVRQSVFGLEGAAARGYWQRMAAMVPPDWAFDGRSRRPAQNPFNAALNYLYGMLYPAVELAVFAAGLDPYMGALHAEDYDRPALTFDCIEPFRPWIDELLLNLCCEGLLELRHFEPRDGGWWVGKAGKAVLIPHFNAFLLGERTDENGFTATVRNHLMTFAGTLADEIRTWYESRPKSNV